jgi:hypothetical protein
MSDKKPHYFELAMRSYSNGEMNQEVIILREFAKTPGELTAKQMAFTKFAAGNIVGVVIDAMDEMSKPIQDMGMAEMAAAMEEFGQGQGQGQKGQGQNER